MTLDNDENEFYMYVWPFKCIFCGYRYDCVEYFNHCPFTNDDPSLRYRKEGLESRSHFMKILQSHQESDDDLDDEDEFEYKNPASCMICGYTSDCLSYFIFCPHTGPDRIGHILCLHGHKADGIDAQIAQLAGTAPIAPECLKGRGLHLADRARLEQHPARVGTEHRKRMHTPAAAFDKCTAMVDQ